MTEAIEKPTPPKPPSPSRAGRKRGRKSGLLLPLLIVGGFLLVFFLGFLYVAFKSFSGSKKPARVTNESVLRVAVQGNIFEINPNDPFAAFLDERPLVFHDYLDGIKKAARDSNFKGMHLQVGMSNLGWAQSRALRAAIEDFQAAGKWVVATGDLWMEKEYFIASVADEIYIPPEGMVFLDGFHISRLYYGELFDKYGINVHVSAFKEYKSYADQYRYREMTEPTRQETRELLDGIQGALFDAIASSRDMARSELEDAFQQAVYSPNDAVTLGLVDGLVFSDQVHEKIAQKLGLNDAGDINFVSLDRYYFPSTSSGSKAVAVIYGSGAIMPGSGDTGFFGDSMIGSSSFIATLKRVREHSSTKAIVIRVDSPGGSLYASDVIWRELERTREMGIPVVASMGNVAASGGYYMAMACDEIYADPLTITGSIGVVNMHIDISGLYREFWLNSDGVKTAPSADFFDGTRALTEAEKSSLDKRTGTAYEAFVTKAANSRDMSFEEFEPHARGRVWLAPKAKELGLIDELGGLDDAVEKAASLASLQDYSIRRYPEEESFLEMFRGSSPFVSNRLPKQQQAFFREALPRELRIMFDLKLRQGDLNFFTLAMPGQVIEIE